MSEHTSEPPGKPGHWIARSLARYPVPSLVLLLILGLAVGAAAVAVISPSPEGPQVEEVKADLWTCSMHPAVKLPKPGPCPICGMNLIPLKDEGGYRQLVLSDEAVKLAEIAYEPVERKRLVHEVNLVGKITYNETLVDYLTAWVPGRLDDLYVDFTGVRVRKGDHMVKLYSPELISAQEELIRSLEAYTEAEERLKRSNDPNNESLKWQRNDSLRNLTSAREKLRLLGLQKEQIERIETLKKPEDHVIIYAPAGGVVIHKNAQEGMYVKTGDRLYTIADLSHVWMEMEAYESDVEWLSLYEDVVFTTKAHPGELFRGNITFIQPVLNDKTRTVTIRVDVANPEMKLKPDMFVSATIRVEADEHGAVKTNRFAGKWSCPMHLEVIEDGPGPCRICKMDLRQIPKGAPRGKPPLVLPASAALKTGTRAVVYVKIPDQELKKKGRKLFEGRTIVLGPRVRDMESGEYYYIVRHGLKEGDLIVRNGNFKLDSSLQIKAKRSMMGKGGGGGSKGHAGMDMGGGGKKKKKMDMAKMKAGTSKFPPSFRTNLAPLYAAYFKVQTALGTGDLKKAKAGFAETLRAADSVDTAALEINPDYKTAWLKGRDFIRDLGNAGLSGSDKKVRTLEDARREFRMLTEAILDLQGVFGHTGTKTHYQFRCTEAFDKKGASWLQTGKSPIRNPYFGGATLQTCGLFQMSLPPRKAGKPALVLPAAFRKQLDPLYTAYFQLQAAFVANKEKAVAEAATALAKRLDAVDMTLVKGSTHMTWMGLKKQLAGTVQTVSAGTDLAAKREAFKKLSKAMETTLRTFGHTRDKPVYILKCSMAGAKWLQTDSETRNPYFPPGDMRGCRTGIDSVSPMKKKGTNTKSGGDKEKAVPNRDKLNFEIELDPTALHSRGIVLEEVLNEIRGANLDAGSGTIEIDGAEYVIRWLGPIDSKEDIENTVIKVVDKVPVFLKDLGTVTVVPPKQPDAVAKSGPEPLGAAAFREQLNGVYTAYFGIRAALAADDSDAVQEAATAFWKQLKAVNVKLLVRRKERKWRTLWEPKQELKIEIDRAAIARYGITVRQVEDAIGVALGSASPDSIEALQKSLLVTRDGAKVPLAQVADFQFVVVPHGYEGISRAGDLAVARQAFKKLSEAMEETLRTFGHALDKPVYVFECSMKRGGRWLQADKKLRNPYYGSEMPTCGSRLEEVVPIKEKKGGNDE